MSRSLVLGFVLLTLCSGMRSAALGQETTADDPAEAQRTLWRRYYAELAPRHRFETANGQIAELEQKPLLFYFNPASGTATHGSMFIWTVDKRPLVIGALWSRMIKDERRVSASFHSTSLETLRGLRDGGQFWTPQEPFVMNHWPNAGQPAPTPQLRLTQMRNLVRRIKAVRTHEDLSTKLRVLTQPVYRYDNEAVVDGAVFGFFDDWDPELFLLVEVRADDPEQWSVGIARFSNKYLTVTHAGDEIWAYDPSGPEPGLGGPEFLYNSDLIATRPAELSEQDLAEGEAR